MYNNPLQEALQQLNNINHQSLKESVNDQKAEARKIIKDKLSPVALGIYASLHQLSVTYTDWFEYIMVDDDNPDHDDDFYNEVFYFLHSKVYKIVEPVKEEIKEKFPTLTKDDLCDLFLEEPLDDVNLYEGELWDETDKFLKDTIKEYEESI